MISHSSQWLVFQCGANPFQAMQHFLKQREGVQTNQKHVAAMKLSARSKHTTRARFPKFCDFSSCEKWVEGFHGFSQLQSASYIFMLNFTQATSPVSNLSNSRRFIIFLCSRLLEHQRLLRAQRFDRRKCQRLRTGQQKETIKA